MPINFLYYGIPGRSLDEVMPNSSPWPAASRPAIAPGEAPGALLAVDRHIEPRQTPSSEAEGRTLTALFPLTGRRGLPYFGRRHQPRGKGKPCWNLLMKRRSIRRFTIRRYRAQLTRSSRPTASPTPGACGLGNRLLADRSSAPLRRLRKRKQAWIVTRRCDRGSGQHRGERRLGEDGASPCPTCG
jgi:hypothetical protein